MQFDVEKLENLVIYACRKAERSALGAVKLHKVLYFSDMLFYAEHGTAITGATYRKRPFGPTCDVLLSSLRSLEKRGAIRIHEVDYFGYLKKEFESLTQPELSRFSELEIALVDEVVDFVCNENSAKTISDFSHNRAWESVEFGDVIRYNSVFSIFPTDVSPEAIEWAKAEVERLASARSSKASVARHDFRDFRDRVLQARGA
ncbi:Panacea domain-containing protein [Methylosinus sp. Ce-a6]|uniref:Panacea domain-containing protein n=1 Tax=Methylosinus sp. Ce-a6 TaxID=2172005 RepID=UPI0013578F63|nr:Panacea domain-containing protein [Methylosinus sp. Ce-a6]